MTHRARAALERVDAEQHRRRARAGGAVEHHVDAVAAGDLPGSRSSGSSACTSIVWSAPSVLASSSRAASRVVPVTMIERGAGLLAGDHLRQPLLARALDQHGRVVADAAVDQRPLDAVRQRRGDAGQLGRDAVRHLVQHRVPRQVHVLGEAAPEVVRVARRRCSRSGGRRGWCASRCARSAGTRPRGTSRSGSSRRSARRRRGRPRRRRAARRTSRPALAIDADVLVAHDHRVGERRLRVHLHVGAADPGDLDLEQGPVVGDVRHRELRSRVVPGAVRTAASTCSAIGPPPASPVSNGHTVCYLYHVEQLEDRADGPAAPPGGVPDPGQQPGAQGRVRSTPAGCALDFEEVPVLVQAFRRMVRDAGVRRLRDGGDHLPRRQGARGARSPRSRSSSSAASTTARSSADTPAPICAPKDLDGRRVGVNRGYTVTTGVWARGDPARRSTASTSTRSPGCSSGDEHVAAYVPPPNVDADPARARARPATAVLAGELAAAVGVETDRPELAPLIPDAGGGRLSRRSPSAATTRSTTSSSSATTCWPSTPTSPPPVFDAFAESKRRYVDAADALAEPTADRPDAPRGCGTSPAPTRCPTARAQPGGARGAGPGTRSTSTSSTAAPRPGRAVRGRARATWSADAVRIAIAADHNGVAIKARLIERLSAAGHRARRPRRARRRDRRLPAAVRGRLPPGGRRARPTAASSSAAAAPGELIACNKIRGIRAGLCRRPVHDRDLPRPTTTRTCWSSARR